MADFSVSIDMEQDTVAALTRGGYELYGFKALRAAGRARPTVWLRTADFSIPTRVEWMERYQAYTSVSRIIPDAVISMSAAYDIRLRQTLNVQGPTAGWVDASSGVTGAVSILNQTSARLTCGIAQQGAGAAFAPLCALELFGNNLDVMAPAEKVFLMFHKGPISIGTLMYNAYDEGILIDLTGVRSRTVRFDVRYGWSWEDGAPWAGLYPHGYDLTRLLVSPAG